VLIFDEVMTGFRVAHGGAQQLYGIQPDMTCLGKIIGGGLPCAAFGGRAEIMNLLAPLGPVYQAGTLSGNPLAMAAGIATLEHLANDCEGVYTNLESASRTLAEGVAAILSDAALPVTTNRVGAMWTWFFTKETVVDFTTAATSDTVAFGRFHRAMMDAGVWLPPSQFEAIFLGTAHTREVIEATLEAAKQAVASLHEAQPIR
jgi:glutamate-1-semialdehyde 2,1-aminomutase